METMSKHSLSDRTMRIKRIAYIGSLLCLCLAILIPMIVVGALWSTSPDALTQILGMTSTSSTKDWKQIGAIITLAIPVFVFAISLLRLRVTFVAFESGRYFSPQAFNALLQFSKWMGASILLSIISQTLAPLWLGKSSLTIQFGSWEFMALGIAALIYLLAHILAQASDIETENRQFI